MIVIGGMATRSRRPSPIAGPAIASALGTSRARDRALRPSPLAELGDGSACACGGRAG
ncbi:MAG: hypothetical protein ACYCVN_14385 [Acidimicrobiales bacterium]